MRQGAMRQAAHTHITPEFGPVILSHIQERRFGLGRIRLREASTSRSPLSLSPASTLRGASY